VAEADGEGDQQLSKLAAAYRQYISAEVQRYSARDLQVLLDYFTHAAPALVAAVEELQVAPVRQEASGEARGNPLPKSRQVT
jgi:hypothetical protein